MANIVYYRKNNKNSLKFIKKGKNNLQLLFFVVYLHIENDKRSNNNLKYLLYYEKVRFALNYADGLAVRQEKWFHNG